MPQEEDDGHAWEVLAHPAEEQVGSYVLDQAPPRDELPVEPVRPGIPEPAGEDPARRTEVHLTPVVRPQVLLAPEAPADAHFAGMEGLEDEAVAVAVVDDLRHPRRPAPPAPGEEGAVPVVPQVHVERAEQPGERSAPPAPVGVV